MSGASFCFGHHINGFAHLDIQLNGLEQEYDLAYKFTEEESDNFIIEQNTGAKAYAEPHLALYISVRHRESPGNLMTLHYGLTRSKYPSRALTPQNMDEAHLLKLIPPYLKIDLGLIKGGMKPASANRITMV